MTLYSYESFMAIIVGKMVLSRVILCKSLLIFKKLKSSYGANIQVCVWFLLSHLEVLTEFMLHLKSQFEKTCIIFYNIEILFNSLFP